MANTSHPPAPDPSGALPSAFDRQMAALHGLPDVVKTKASTVRTIPPLGIGGVQVWIIQTYRQSEIGDTTFLEMVGPDGATRLALPPAVMNVIARQRDQLTAKSRSRAAKAVAQERKARGEQPGFLKRASS